MKIFPRIIRTELSDVILGILSLLVSLFFFLCLAYFPIQEFSNTWRLVITFFFWTGSELGMDGVRIMARTYAVTNTDGSPLIEPFHKLLTQLIKNNLAKVHPEFIMRVIGDLIKGVFWMFVWLFFLWCLVYRPLHDSSNSGTFVITFFFWAGALMGIDGIRAMAATIPFHESLTQLVENNIAPEEMSLTIRAASYYNDDVTVYYTCADLRFLDETPDHVPAIIVKVYPSIYSWSFWLNVRPRPNWSRRIASGTKVKVYGARIEGPVVIETKKDFIRPASRGCFKRREYTQRYAPVDTPEPPPLKKGLWTR